MNAKRDDNFDWLILHGDDDDGPVEDNTPGTPDPD